MNTLIAILAWLSSLGLAPHPGAVDLHDAQIEACQQRSATAQQADDCATERFKDREAEELEDGSSRFTGEISNGF